MILEKWNSFKNLMLLYVVYIAYLNVMNMNFMWMKKCKTSRPWTRFIYKEHEREIHGFFSNLFSYIKNHDEDQFRKATRMGVSQFTLLSNLLKKRLTKQDFIRKSISAECRLAITLVYLSQGCCWQMLAWAFRAGVSTVREIILETCDVIWDELNEIYLAQPNTTEWDKIVEEFYKSTGMPNVVGAIDGKHIEIKCPPKSESLYFNYKQFFSIVLLAACDSNYTFTAIDIGAYGCQSDGGVLQNSGFGKQIMNGTINIPKIKKLPNSDIELPCFFIGDAAFPLKTNIMRPYPGRLLPSDKQTFNKKLSRARVRIENTFGILTAKWRVLSNSLNMFPKNCEKIVKATIVLHNFLKLNDANYCSEKFVDQYNNDHELVQEGEWRNEIVPLRQSRLFSRFNASRNAFGIRDCLKDYLK